MALCEYNHVILNTTEKMNVDFWKTRNKSLLLGE